MIVSPLSFSAPTDTSSNELSPASGNAGMWAAVAGLLGQTFTADAPVSSASDAPTRDPVLAEALAILQRGAISSVLVNAEGPSAAANVADSPGTGSDPVAPVPGFTLPAPMNIPADPLQGEGTFGSVGSTPMELEAGEVSITPPHFGSQYGWPSGKSSLLASRASQKEPDEPDSAPQPSAGISNFAPLAIAPSGPAASAGLNNEPLSRVDAATGNPIAVPQTATAPGGESSRQELAFAVRLQDANVPNPAGFAPALSGSLNAPGKPYPVAAQSASESGPAGIGVESTSSVIADLPRESDDIKNSPLSGPPPARSGSNASSSQDLSGAVRLQRSDTDQTGRDPDSSGDLSAQRGSKERLDSKSAQTFGAAAGAGSPSVSPHAIAQHGQSSATAATSLRSASPETPVAAKYTAAAAPLPPAGDDGPAQQVRDLSLRISDGTSRSADVRITERAGEVRISVRSADPGLNANLRDGLSDLASRIDRHPVNSEIWRPAAAASREADNQPQGQGENRGNPHSQSGQDGGSNSGDGDQTPRRQQGNVPHWLEEMETSLGTSHDRHRRS